MKSRKICGANPFNLGSSGTDAWMSDKKARIKLTLSYRGTAYHGWQVQNLSELEVSKRGKDCPTVQGVLQRMLGEVVGHPVSVTGSSRTDTGVHAKGQVCHFDTTARTIPMLGLLNAVNARLPEDIVVRSAEVVEGAEWVESEPGATDVGEGVSGWWEGGFNAISWTKRKRYQYVVWCHPVRHAFLSDLAFYRWQKLDLEAMKTAASLLEGTHDFTSFARPGHGRDSAVRTVHECSVSRRGPLIVIGVTGSGFLWNMVRIMAGTLVDIGRGAHRPDVIPAMLAAKDRTAAGQTAPAHGLYLQWIEFEKPKQNEQVMANSDE